MRDAGCEATQVLPLIEQGHKQQRCSLPQSSVQTHRAQEGSGRRSPEKHTQTPRSRHACVSNYKEGPQLADRFLKPEKRTHLLTARGERRIHRTTNKHVSIGRYRLFSRPLEAVVLCRLCTLKVCAGPACLYRSCPHVYVCVYRHGEPACRKTPSLLSAPESTSRERCCRDLLIAYEDFE